MIPERDNDKLREVLSYLRDEGMDRELLRDLHYSPRRTESFAGAIYYRSLGHENYSEAHIIYHRRLLFVAAEHWRTGWPFKVLVAQAQERFAYA